VQKRKYLMEEMGVDGFKTDGGEHVWDPEAKFYNGLTGSQGINTYPVTYESAYHNLCESLRGPDHVLFSRAGYTGVQKYSCHWLGDEVSTWEVFRAGVIAMQNAGMCGLSFMGWDIAGFAGELPSSELYLRATAFSVFCPIMQFHSDGNGRRIPSRDRTPWNIQEQSGDPEVLPIFKQLTNLRMNLMPYILEQAKQSSQTGLPLMRALGVEYPQDEACRELPYEYMFGEDLLVAPVVEAGRTELDVYLPEGRWSDLWTGEIFDGRRTIHMAVPRDCIPVFQRKNSIVPLSLGEEREICSPVGSATENIQNLTLLVFPGERQEIKINQGKEHPALHMLVQEDAGLRRIELRELRIPVDLWIVGAEPREINYNGVKLPRTESNTGLNEASWQEMTNRHAVRIHIPGGERRANLLLE
jgi:alpha-glucosidase (family GH31 glycosyl hydrolase)